MYYWCIRVRRRCRVLLWWRVLPANQPFFEWAMLDSNQRLPPCKGGEMLCQRFLEFAKSPQISHIFHVEIFSTFQDIHLGCYTVAAQRVLQAEKDKVQR